MDSRSIYILAIILCFGAAVVNVLVFGIELKRFTEKTSSLASTRDVERFKVVVAHQMYGALAQILLLVTPPILYVVGLFKGPLTHRDLLFVVVPSIVVVAIAVSYRSWERRAKSIEAADAQLEAQRDAIVETWLTKPFPDW